MQLSCPATWRRAWYPQSCRGSVSLGMIMCGAERSRGLCLEGGRRLPGEVETGMGPGKRELATENAVAVRARCGPQSWLLRRRASLRPGSTAAPQPSHPCSSLAPVCLVAPPSAAPGLNVWESAGRVDPFDSGRRVGLFVRAKGCA